MIEKITDSDFEEKISNGIVLVDFWAPWCGPCNNFMPIVEDLSEDLKDKIKVFKCNIDENPDFPSKFEIRTIPTIIIFKNGKVLKKQVGSMLKTAFYDLVNSVIEK